MGNAERLVKLLTNKHLTIGSVESLTAGEFIATLADVPGASKVVRGGLVTYQVSLKTSLLGIKPSTIKKYGVVSKEIAKEMAIKGEKILKSDIVVSFTGNAGPTCEPGGAEVGRVHMAILCKPNDTKLNFFTKVYKGTRNQIRSRVSEDMINYLLKEIK